MTIGVLKEPGKETRASLLPEHVLILMKQQVEVIIESNAGANAFAGNDQYENAGARVVTRNEVLQGADIILSISALGIDDIALCNGKILFGFYQPLFNAQLIKSLSEKIQHDYRV